MDREWREAIDMRSSLISVGVVLLSAAVLRFWNLSREQPSAIESEIIAPVLQLLQTGAYRPDALTRPTLPIYLQMLVAIVHFVWGAIVGIWRSVSEFGPRQVVTWGRGLSALAGVAVVLLVYQIGMRWGARHALLAAGLMAVTPTHVGVSREVGDGSLVALFSALTLLHSLRGVEQGTLRRFVIAGAAAGLAMGCHYGAIIVLVVPLTAAWMTTSEETSRGSRATAVLVTAVVAFLIATPLAVRNLPAFLNGVALAAAPDEIGMSRTIDLVRQLQWTLQWPGLILALAGIVLGIVRVVTGPGHTRWTLLVSFPIVYFILVAWHGSVSRTVLVPMLPAMTVLAAIAVVSGVSLLRRFAIPRAARTALIAGLTVIAVLPPAVMSIALVRDAARGLRTTQAFRR